MGANSIEIRVSIERFADDLQRRLDRKPTPSQVTMDAVAQDRDPVVLLERKTDDANHTALVNHRPVR